MIQALDGSIATAFLCPTRNAEHGNPSTGGQHPKDNLAHLAQGFIKVLKSLSWAFLGNFGL